MARTLSILVLDDNTENANSLAELLSLDDHKVQRCLQRPGGHRRLSRHCPLTSDFSMS